jgi:hypothetical protein
MSIKTISIKTIFIKKICLTALTLTTITPAFALFCPANFNQINFGDTISQVVEQCGKPIAQHTYSTSTDVPQEWSYYIQMSPDNPAALKTSIAFNKGHVVNITINGITINTTSLCGTTIQVGDTPQAVLSACGKPPYINKSNTASYIINTITEMTYQGTSEVTLIFENGRLKDRK